MDGRKVSPAARATRGAKRLRVLEEAAHALNTRGVSQTSLADIAQRVGVSRAALYYYFEDQEDLVFQCYRQSCELMSQRLGAARGLGLGPMATLDAFIDGMLPEGGAEFAALSEAAFLRPEQRQIILGLYEGVLGNIAEVLVEGVACGALRPCGARVAAQAIIGLVSWIPLARRWRTSDPLSHADLVQAIKDLLRWGVAADRSQPAAYRPFELSPPGVLAGRVFDTAAMAEARQEALMAAASWLFNLKGVDATSLEEVAERVGVTKKVIYHNVGGKETLVAQCYRRSFRIHEHIAAMAVAYDGARIEAITATAHAAAEAALREDITPLASLAGFEALPDAVREEIQDSAGRLMNGYLQLYAEGRAENSVRELSTRAVLAVIPALHQWLPKWFDVLGPAERAAAPRELAELVRRGLSPL